VLNDCKYGISVNGGSLQLSLHKGGLHPDFKGDKDGIHRCVYSLLPHASGFNAKDVIRPAYELNVPALAVKGSAEVLPLVKVDAPNIFVEAVKPCEDAEKAYIVRLYEAQGSQTRAKISLPACVSGVSETNMLEEKTADHGRTDSLELVFRPFEIKTVKVNY
jgi:alpha-mannosidase